MPSLSYFPIVTFGLITLRIIDKLTEERSDASLADRSEEVLENPGQPRTRQFYSGL